MVIKTVSFVWEQTQCGDPWVNDLSNDFVSIKNFNEYLTAAGFPLPLYGVGLKAVSAPSANCTACNCKTGKIFSISVADTEEGKQKYLQAGFHLQ